MSNKLMKKLMPASLLTLIFLTTILSNPALADRSYKKNGNENMRQALVLIEHKMFPGAIRCLKNAAEEMPNNADVYNLLGFSHRKLKRYDEASTYYKKALQLDPKHKSANEYLGELYVETGDLEKAQQQLAILDKLCLFKCKEYKKLKKIIAAADGK